MKSRSLLVLLLLAPLAYGQFVLEVSFDTVSAWTAGSGGINSYQTDHVHAEAGLRFTGGPAMRQTSSIVNGTPGALGTHAWRLRDDPSVNWTATYTDALAAGDFISEFGFETRSWAAANGADFTVSYSFDGGLTHLPAGTLDDAFLGNSTDWTSFRFSIGGAATHAGLAADNFVVTVAANGNTERIMIDNFSLTIDSGLAPIPEPSAFGLLLGLGLLAGLITRRQR
jgi:hypothetical protein